MDSLSNSQAQPGLHSPLLDSDEIRLLDLHPKSSGTAIKCTLRHARITDELQYEALSYVWGAKNFQTIELNGKTFQVRENLGQALSHLRLENKHRTLWIDAICINQEDINERNHQVMQMKLIYSKAVIVIAWLGMDDPAICQGFQACKEVALSNNFSWSRKIEHIDAVISLCSRKYWTRLWIIQEIRLAKDVCIRSGDLQLDWIHFSKTVLKLEWALKTVMRAYISTIILRESTAYHLCCDRNEFRTASETFKNPEILGKLCSKYGKSQCEDKRDKVFGLHGLAVKCCQDAISIDYSASWPLIYDSVFLHHLDHMSISQTIKQSQDFHKGLTIGLKELDYIYQIFDAHKFPLTYQRHIHVRSYLKGRILYLMQLKEQPDESNEGSRQLIPLPNQARRKLTLLRQYQKLCAAQDSGIGCHLDVVLSFSRPFCPGNITQHLDKITLDDQHTNENTFQSVTMDYIRKILNINKYIASCPCAGDLIMAFTKNGIFFVPQDARIGDLVCTFEDSDVVAIAREEDSARGGNCELIGRGVDIFAEELPPGFENEFDKSRPPSDPQVNFIMNVPTLQLLTITTLAN